MVILISKMLRVPTYGILWHCFPIAVHIFYACYILCKCNQLEIWIHVGKVITLYIYYFSNFPLFRFRAFMHKESLGVTFFFRVSVCVSVCPQILGNSLIFFIRDDSNHSCFWWGDFLVVIIRDYMLYWLGTQRNPKPKVDLSVFWSIDQNIS